MEIYEYRYMYVLLNKERKQESRNQKKAIYKAEESSGETYSYRNSYWLIRYFIRISIDTSDCCHEPADQRKLVMRSMIWKKALHKKTIEEMSKNT